MPSECQIPNNHMLLLYEAMEQGKFPTLAEFQKMLGVTTSEERLLGNLVKLKRTSFIVPDGATMTSPKSGSRIYIADSAISIIDSSPSLVKTSEEVSRTAVFIEFSQFIESYDRLSECVNDINTMVGTTVRLGTIIDALALAQTDNMVGPDYWEAWESDQHKLGYSLRESMGRRYKEFDRCRPLVKRREVLLIETQK